MDATALNNVIGDLLNSQAADAVASGNTEALKSIILMSASALNSAGAKEAEDGRRRRRRRRRRRLLSVAEEEDDAAADGSEVIGSHPPRHGHRYVLS